ncbi:unnamed protein product [Arabis nemorensis]|uniref:Uncharacterized protein n=1 Tax=Arabis nemorensis TaxID=586526 RepID=A0A565AXA7_9BRAS|nr:unnamed protein product [Arabis nemorensis]
MILEKRNPQVCFSSIEPFISFRSCDCNSMRNVWRKEPPEEEEENYILGCMFKCKSVYKCRYCPKIICLNEISIQAHVSSKKHAYLERLHKEENHSTDDEEVDDPEEKQIKGNRRARRQGKRSLKKGKLGTEKDEVEKSETPSQIKGNRKARRQGMMRSQIQEKGSSTTQRESAGASQKSRKKRRKTKD